MWQECSVAALKHFFFFLIITLITLKSDIIISAIWTSTILRQAQPKTDQLKACSEIFLSSYILGEPVGAV